MDITKAAEAVNLLLTTVLSWPGFLAWSKTRKEHDSSIDKLLLRVAKNQLVSQGREYLNRGYITMDEYEEYESEYKVYTVMGGNGLARRIFEQVDDLPMLPNGINGRTN